MFFYFSLKKEKKKYGVKAYGAMGLVGHLATWPMVAVGHMRAPMHALHATAKLADVVLVASWQAYAAPFLLYIDMVDVFFSTQKVPKKYR